METAMVETPKTMREVMSAVADTLDSFGGNVTGFKILPVQKQIKLTVSFDSDVSLWDVKPKALPAGDNPRCGRDRLTILSKL